MWFCVPELSCFLGPCASLLFLCDHCSLFLGYCVFLFCLQELHCITFMHFILVFLFNKKKKRGKERKEKGSTLLFLHYTLCFWKQGWSIYIHMTCLLYFVELWWAYLLHFTSGSFVMHVMWERCLWCLPLCLYLEVTCYLTVGLDPFEKGINNHLTTVH